MILTEAWRDTQPDEYFPQTGIESMYSKIFLREIYRYLSDFLYNQPDDNPVIPFTTFMNSLLDQYGRPRRQYA